MDTVIDDDLLALAAFFLLHGELAFDMTALIDEIADAQLQQVRGPQRGVNTDDEQEQVAVAALPAQQGSV